VVTERGSLEGKDEAFIDTSASNPWTLIVGVYAGLAADDDSALKSLHELSRHACGSPQVTASPAAEEFARALVAAAVGQDGAAARLGLEAGKVRAVVFNRCAKAPRHALSGV